MRRNVNRRTFISMFVFFFIFIFVIEACIFGIFIFRDQKNNDTKNLQHIQETADMLDDYLIELIRQEKMIAMQEKQLPLIIKIASGSPVFSEETDAYHIQRLVPYMKFFTQSANSNIFFRFIYFPKTNQVLYSNGLIDTKTHFDSHNFSFIIPEEIPVRDENTDFLSYEKYIEFLKSESSASMLVDSYYTGSENGNILLTSMALQNSSHSNAFHCTGFKIDAIQNNLLKMMPPEFVRTEMIYVPTGETLLSADQGAAEDATMTINGSVIEPFKWQLKIYIDEDALVKRSDVFVKASIFSTVILALTFFISLLCTLHMYKPLGKILKLMPSSNSNQDAYQNIANNFDKISQTLKTERRENILRKLISESVFPDDPDLKLVTIQEDMWVQCFALYPKEEKRRNDKIIAALEMMLDEHPDWKGELLLNKGHSLILIVGTPEKQGLYNVLNTIEHIQEEKEYYIFSGGICKGYTGIGESFRMILEQEFYRSLAQIPLFYLPIEFEKQLIYALEDGNEKMSQNLLDQIQDENSDRFMNGEIARVDILQLGTRIMTDFVRVVKKKNLDSDILQPLESINFVSIENMFAVFRDVVDKINAQINDRSLSVNKEGIRIVNYINEHFSDTTFSIVTLQEEFNLSATTINKNIKLVTGQTFLPYLTNVRMDKAKELLRDHKNKISDVRLKVGYEQENSFRRAFRKYTGYNPQDYIASLHQEDDE